MNRLTEADIEETVQKRRKKKALKLIRLWIKADPKNWDRRIQCSEWLRRLGMYRNALQILKPEQLTRTSKTSKEPSSRALLQVAHIFNELGANDFAARIIEGFECHNAEAFRILGQIHSNQFEFEEAAGYYKQLLKFQRGSTYRERLNRIAYADVCSANDAHQRALSTIEKVIEDTHESLLKGICLQARGEYLARASRYGEALVQLKKVIPYFPKDEGTADSAMLWKWMGFVQAQLGHRKNALQNFRRSEKILLALHTRAEAFLDLLRLKRIAGLLSGRDWKRVLNYPGISKEFKKLLLNADAKEASGLYLRAKENPLLHIDLSRNEYKYRKKTYLGIPIEIKCVALLRLVEDWGMSAARLQNNLWPGEPYSFLQLQKRLEAIFHRLRTVWKIPIDNQRGVVRLSQCNRISLIQGNPGRPSLFDVKISLVRKDVEVFYDLSPTQAKFHIYSWIQLGWVRAEGKGPRTWYKII